MKTLIVREGNYNEFLKYIKPKIKEADLILLNFCVLEKVNYAKEIEGENNKIKLLLKLSKDFNCVVMAGALCDLFGKTYCSVIVCDRGELLGIADSVYENENYDSASEFKIYETRLGRIGVVVNSDILNIKTVNTLKLYEPTFLVNICNELEVADVNTSIFNSGKKNALSIIGINKNSIIYYNKKLGENKLMFDEFNLEDYKI